MRVLKDAATEIERRLLGPYKDTDITKNGDLECFNEPYSLKPTITTHEEVIEKQNLERIREINARRRQEELNKVVLAAPGITEPDLKDVAEELAKHIEQQRKEANG